MHRIHLTERELQELEEREAVEGHELEELGEAVELALCEEVLRSGREPAPGKPLDFGS